MAQVQQITFQKVMFVFILNYVLIDEFLDFYDQSPSQSSMGGFPTSPLSMYSGNNSQAIQPNQNNGLDFVEDSSGNGIVIFDS